MIVNDVMAQFLAADPQMGNAMANALPVDMVEPVDISNAILWLVSDDARYVTGVTLPVDAGFTNKKLGLAERTFRMSLQGGKTCLPSGRANNAGGADGLAAARDPGRPDGALGQHGAVEHRVRR
jgi:hypothetical protein